MLVVFRRYLFRLKSQLLWLFTVVWVALLLDRFHISYLKDRHFHFSVASKHVGLLVRALKRITTDHFDIYFHMWRYGGEN
jgi:hypothetical protein